MSVFVKPVLSTIFLVVSALHGLVLLLVGEGRVPMTGRNNMAVVVTGCDTGFGAALAPALAADGYTVFACCLKKERWIGIELPPAFRNYHDMYNTLIEHSGQQQHGRDQGIAVICKRLHHPRAHQRH